MEFCRHGLAMVRSMYTGVSKLRVKGQNLLRTQHPWPWHPPVAGGKWERTKARNTRIINVINKELLDPRKEQGVTSSTHCVPRHSYKTDSPLLDFQLLMGLSIFIAESLAIFHPQLQVIETAHLHRRGGWGELPLRGWGTRPDPGSAQGSDWSSGSIPGFWLAAGNTGGLSDLVLAGLPALTSQNHLLKHFNILPVIGKFESS